jgi:hypothetical protein
MYFHWTKLYLLAQLESDHLVQVSDQGEDARAFIYMLKSTMQLCTLCYSVHESLMLGKPHKYASIACGSCHIQHTYEGHVWKLSHAQMNEVTIAWYRGTKRRERLDIRDIDVIECTPWEKTASFDDGDENDMDDDQAKLKDEQDEAVDDVKIKNQKYNVCYHGVFLTSDGSAQRQYKDVTVCPNHAYIACFRVHAPSVCDRTLPSQKCSIPSCSSSSSIASSSSSSCPISKTP